MLVGDSVLSDCFKGRFDFNARSTPFGLVTDPPLFLEAYELFGFTGPCRVSSLLHDEAHL